MSLLVELATDEGVLAARLAVGALLTFRTIKVFMAELQYTTINVDTTTGKAPYATASAILLALNTVRLGLHGFKSLESSRS